MKLVVDTNILISALIKDSTNRKIIFSGDFELHVPEHAFSEIEGYKDMIITKSKLDPADYELFFNLLKGKVSIAAEKDVRGFMKEAEKIMDPIDEDDTVFIALALALECPVWSNDSDFMKQKKVRIYTTDELLKKVKMS
ncbi:MAG: PIN domain-containing protein [Euryarchaeota archaeon]|nr:PIN domain-containing protein [Euryarchaeota archaeon]